jgi:cephalosporin-C deacetylase
MPLFDLPLEDLEKHVTDLPEPADLGAFWETTLADARDRARPAVFSPHPTPFSAVDTFDVTFSGFGGRPVKGWLLTPRRITEKVTCVVQYVGHGGGRGFPNQWLTWPAAGYATFVMDNRGQGGDSYPGDTADFAVQDVHAAGFLTHGVLDPVDYYYRRLFTDATLALTAAASHPRVGQVLVAGPSQGGALAIAAAALSDQVVAAMPDVPFLCDVRRASLITAAAPYAELATYLRAHPHREHQVFATLAYFDGAVLARRATAPALFSVGLMDEVAPPSTVYAAYNAWAGAKSICAYTYSGHEGGGARHLDRQLEFAGRFTGLTRRDEIERD